MKYLNATEKVNTELKNCKNIVAVNIWSADSQFFLIKKSWKPLIAPIRVQDSRQNFTATVLLISYVPYRISSWGDFY